MAHEIESTFSVGETPWHGLGKVLEEAPSVAEAIKLAGLDWAVRTSKIYLADGTEVQSHKANVRSSDGSVLGVVGNRYTPLQNAEAFAFFDPIVAAGLANLETAGSLRDGQRVWILCRVLTGGSDVSIVGDDIVRKFILLSNGHDGSLAVRVGFTPVRVVCANTLAMAHQDGASQLIRLKHSASIVANLDRVREIMNLANQSFEATADQYRQLARHDISQKDLETYVRFVLGHGATKDADLSTRAKNQIENVISLFETGRGNTVKGVRGTAWAAYNAVTEFLSHENGADADKRYNSLWFGQNADRNSLALSAALELVAA